MVGAKIVWLDHAFLRDGRSYGRHISFGVPPPVLRAAPGLLRQYLDVTPGSRIVWTNDEGGEGGAVTTVTFEERGGETLVVLHDLYPSKEALDEAIASGGTGGFNEQFAQLDELLAA